MHNEYSQYEYYYMYKELYKMVLVIKKKRQSLIIAEIDKIN